MALTVGSRLGHYDVSALIGEGGMGQVYQATDTKLNRQVALKILPEAFAAAPDRLARFQREAQVLASLNHPGIAQIHGIEEQDGTQALVLELVEGPTLADRIARGPIPVDESLPIAKQIAEALEAAHEAGVIHRDLKPANIKVRADGTVKVLDFGLAKALDTAPEGDPSQSPTLTAAATQMGVIMGTAAYMSPEQARGKPVDERADIWAFGSILYEMITGSRVWEGESTTDVLAAVVSRAPDYSRLPADVGPSLEPFLTRCLRKEASRRWQAAGDIRIEIEEILASPQGRLEPTEQPSRGLSAIAAWTAVGAILGGLGVGLAMWGTRPVPERPIFRSSITLAGHLARLETPALSPDGGLLVYAANSQLYLRPMDELESTPIPGTEGAASPFFAPDGRSVGFFTRTQLKRVELSGGAPTVVADVRWGLGGAWGPDNEIIFGRVGQFGLSRVSANGGDISEFVSVDSNRDVEFPEFLPGGEWVLFTEAVDIDNWSGSNIVAVSLRTGERRPILERGQMPRYSPSGHSVFARDGWLYGVGFDADTLAVAGEPVALQEGLTVTNDGVSTQFALAADGTMVYTPHVVRNRALVWVDREGRETPTALPVRDYYWPRLSPDGARVAVTINDADTNVWVSDLARGTLTNLTSDPADDEGPIWSQDGERVLFASTRGSGSFSLFEKSADGSGQAKRLFPVESSGYVLPFSWSSDGSALTFQYLGATTNSDIGLHMLGSGEAFKPLIATGFFEHHPTVSPDGEWIAYTSDQTGTFQVYVQRFPGLGEMKQVSTDGGRAPVWAKDGRELFYRRFTDGAIMAVPLTGDADPGEAGMLFGGSSYSTGADLGDEGFVNYDVSEDGQRFLMIKDETDSADEPRVVVVRNWDRELRERVPVH